MIKVKKIIIKIKKNQNLFILNLTIVRKIIIVIILIIKVIITIIRKYKPIYLFSINKYIWFWYKKYNYTSNT